MNDLDDANARAFGLRPPAPLPVAAVRRPARKAWGEPGAPVGYSLDCLFNALGDLCYLAFEVHGRSAKTGGVSPAAGDRTFFETYCEIAACTPYVGLGSKAVPWSG